MLKKKKVLALLTTTMIVVGSLGLSAYGASVSKTLQAYYGTSRIIIDGKDVTNTIEPFIVDGTTYIPLRAVANAFNKKVEWNALTSTANITEDLTQVNQYYQAEILKRDVKIMELESKVKSLEKELESKKEITLSDLQKQLNKDHDKYKKVEFDITLSGSKSKITVKIETDLHDFSKEWKELKDSHKVSYLQDIVDDILDAYPDASVTGYIRDIDAKKDILDFSVDKKGKVSIDTKSSSSGTLAGLEDDLNDDFYDYFKKEKIDFDIELKGTKNDITFYVDLKNSSSSKAWEKLTSGDKKAFMKEIHDDIADEYKKANIEGFVYYGDKELYEY